MRKHRKTTYKIMPFNLYVSNKKDLMKLLRQIDMSMVPEVYVIYIKDTWGLERKRYVAAWQNGKLRKRYYKVFDEKLPKNVKVFYKLGDRFLGFCVECTEYNNQNLKTYQRYAKKFGWKDNGEGVVLVGKEIPLYQWCDRMSDTRYSSILKTWREKIKNQRIKNPRRR